MRPIAFLVFILVSSLGFGQSYPSKPVRVIVPFSPGGVADSSARVVAERLGARLGQSVVVENRPGASGNIGTAAVAGSAPDGYTLLLGFDGTMVVNPHVYAKLPFDTLRDFAPVTKLGDATLILVAHPSVPAANLREFLAQGKSQSYSYGTAGTGSTPHLAGELLAQRTGVALVHVPYKGGGQAIIAGISGQIPLVFTAVATAQQYVKSGRLVALGVPGAKRSSSLPNVPTFVESGVPGFDVTSWVGILAPAKTPRPIIDRLSREIAAAIKAPDLKDSLGARGFEPVGSTPEEYAAQLRAEFKRYAHIVKVANIRVE